MLRLIVLLLSTTQLINVSGSSGAFQVLKTKNVKAPKVTPHGVASLELSALNGNESELEGDTFTSPLNKDAEEVVSPLKPVVKKLTMNGDQKFIDGRGTPLVELFSKKSTGDSENESVVSVEAKKVPVKSTNTRPLGKLSCASSDSDSSASEETAEDSEVESVLSVEVKKVPVTLGTIKSTNTRPLGKFWGASSDSESSASKSVDEAEDSEYSVAESDDEEYNEDHFKITENQDIKVDKLAGTLGNVKLINSLPIRTEKAVFVEDVDSDSDSEASFISADSVKLAEYTSAFISKSADISADAIDDSSADASVDIMKYDTIDSILNLSHMERFNLSVALSKQISDSENFRSEIKLADLPSSLFLFKISLIVRRHRSGKHLTKMEFRNTKKLLKAIYDCRMKISDLIEILEFLKRAEFKEVFDEIISEILIPLIIKLHRKRQNEKEDFGEVQFLTMLSIYGRVSVLNDLLADRFTGRLLRSNLSNFIIKFLLQNLMTNGSISDSEISKSFDLLLKGKNSKEFKRKFGRELVEICGKNRNTEFLNL